MGDGKRRKRPSAPPVRKQPVVTEATGTEATGTEATGTGRPEGCPEQVKVVGRADEPSTIGETAELTLAGDQPQLVVARRVAEILSTEPPLDVITRCLQLRETYLGKVTAVWPDRFEAILTRGH